MTLLFVCSAFDGLTEVVIGKDEWWENFFVGREQALSVGSDLWSDRLRRKVNRFVSLLECLPSGRGPWLVARSTGAGSDGLFPGSASTSSSDSSFLRTKKKTKSKNSLVASSSDIDIITAQQRTDSPSMRVWSSLFSLNFPSNNYVAKRSIINQGKRQLQSRIRAITVSGADLRALGKQRNRWTNHLAI